MFLRLLFEIPDSDRFSPKDALPILALPSQTSSLDLFTFCFHCLPLKRKYDLDCILLSEGQINMTVMLYGGKVKRKPKELMVTGSHLCGGKYGTFCGLAWNVYLL